MKSVGLPISHKENERRRTLVPRDIPSIKHPDLIFIEKGYGDVLGYRDEDYSSLGVNVADRSTVLAKDIIADPKVGDAEYLDTLKGQTVFGWLHAVQNRDITDKVITEEVAPIIYKVAENNQLEVIDFHDTITDTAMMVSDGIHPNDKGAALMAKKAAEAILSTPPTPTKKIKKTKKKK